jgi:hypothetical protein
MYQIRLAENPPYTAMNVAIFKYQVSRYPSCNHIGQQMHIAPKNNNARMLVM